MKLNFYGIANTFHNLVLLLKKPFILMTVVIRDIEERFVNEYLIKY